MPLTLRRFTETVDQGTLGQLTLPNELTLYTIEQGSTGAHPRIPAGLYEMHLGMYWGGDGPGGKADYPAYELAVPGRTLIKIHVANWAHQLLGCIAPGRTLGFMGGKVAVQSSVLALRALMESLHGAKQDYITIVDPHEEA
jgi:hypothetical protein